VSALDEELAPEDGVLEPLAAPLLGVELGELLPLALELDDDGELGVLELDEDGELGLLALPDMEPEVEPEAEPEGELGVVLEPLDDVAPEPGLEAARSPSVLSQPASNPAPSARETATAKAESLIVGPPWVGVKTNGARFRPDAVPS
jgi:hypothetical protein